MSDKLKTVNIKGKEYVEVNERIKAFRSKNDYIGYKLKSEWLEINEKMAICKAIILNKENEIVAEGTAMEKCDSSFINKTSHIENCETSAWGRALGNLGIGIDTSICTAEELTNAVNNQNKKQPENKIEKIPEKKEEIKSTTSIKLISEAQLRLINKLISDTGTDREAVKSYYKIDSLKDLTSTNANKLIKKLQEK